ncbi:MAG: hypothetical protein ABDH49_05915 [Candidatus Hydrothermales bacterium]
MKKIFSIFFKILKDIFVILLEAITIFFLLIFYYSIFGIIAIFYRLLSNLKFKRESSMWLKSKRIGYSLKDFESEGY